jgi:hypothetical protein
LFLGVKSLISNGVIAKKAALKMLITKRKTGACFYGSKKEKMYLALWIKTQYKHKRYLYGRRR